MILYTHGFARNKLIVWIGGRVDPINRHHEWHKKDNFR